MCLLIMKITCNMMADEILLESFEVGIQDVSFEVGIQDVDKYAAKISHANTLCSPNAKVTAVDFIYRVHAWTRDRNGTHRSGKNGWDG